MKRDLKLFFLTTLRKKTIVYYFYVLNDPLSCNIEFEEYLKARLKNEHVQHLYSSLH